MNKIEELKAELQQFKDMAKKGLDEFKDVGGCWGCGLQLQLNQDMEDIKRLKAENEQLKELKCEFKEYCTCNTEKYIQTLQEIKAIAEQCMTKDACFECKYSDDCYIEDHEIPTYDICKLLIQKITKAEDNQ